MAEASSSTVIDGSEDDQFKQTIHSIAVKIRTFQEEIIPKTSIYKVRSKETIRDANRPHFMSIGPIHGGCDDLLAMEDMKLWYAMFFFYRSKVPSSTLQVCGKAIFNLDTQVRDYYAHDLKKFDEYALMKILLVDGCFLLELFLRNAGERQYTFLKDEKIDTYREIKTTSDDLILGNPWIRSSVCQDLALLENQIPLVVLETLFSEIKPYLKYSNIDVKHYTLHFFSSDSNYTRNATCICIDREESRPLEEPRHILEMLHNGLLPSGTLENGKKTYGLKHCATKLMESGVNIQKKFNLSNETDNFDSRLLDIEFDRNKGILRIPQFWIGGTTSLITKNLVAFEQCCFGRYQSHHVTAYVMFMKSLIRSEQDVQLLKRKGIIKQHPSSASDQNITEYISGCCEGVALKDFYFSKVCEEVEVYSKNWIMHSDSYVTWLRSRRRKYAAVLGRRYCPDACMTIAFFAATVLLLLTCLQTFYTVYPYYHK